VTDALEHDLIVHLIGPPAGLRILDVGCGDGALAVELSKRGAIVTGIDVSVRMIEAARERARRHGVEVTFNVAAVQSLPFPPEAFDRVVAVTVLCFVADAGTALREMARVLRPGGRLVIGELGKWSMWAAERRIRGWFGNCVWRQARFRTPGELLHLADGAGLVAEALQGAIYYPPCGLAARLLAPLDRHVGRSTAFGAAFLAVAATKPAT
jgi:ubiquinone biosynthesis O-methyltransferase